MKTRQVINRVMAGRIFVCALLMVVAVSHLHAQNASDLPYPIIIKISGPDELLKTIDGMAGDGERPTAMLRNMVSGTEWMDPSRATVIGVEVSGETPRGIILVPFLRENKDFQAAYKAIVDKDFYLLSYPSGGETAVPPEIKAFMVKESLSAKGAGVRLSLAISDLLAKNRDKVDTIIAEAKADMAENLRSDPKAPSAEEIAQMLNGLVNILSQARTLSLGMAFESDDIRVSAEAVALPQSGLARTFSRPGGEMLTAAFPSTGHIKFRSASYDTTAVIELLNSAFGKFGNAAGLDLAGMADISGHMTGEASGGVLIDKNTMKMEMVR